MRSESRLLGLRGQVIDIHRGLQRCADALRSSRVRGRRSGLPSAKDRPAGLRRRPDQQPASERLPGPDHLAAHARLSRPGHGRIAVLVTHHLPPITCAPCTLDQFALLASEDEDTVVAALRALVVRPG